MAAYRLQALLDVRARAEEEGRRALGVAVAARQAADVEQARLDEEEAAARRRAVEARGQSRSGDRAADGARSATWIARLRDAAEKARRAAAEHRAGPWARAVTAEEEARAALARARQEREALEKQKAGLAAAARKQGERRAEDEADDRVAAAHKRRA